MLSVFLKDFYKADHKSQYPAGTEYIYSNFTARKSRLSGTEEIVFFGMQYLIKEYLIKNFNDNFFNLPQQIVLANYKGMMDACLGKDAIDTAHIKDLHDLGYLPIKIKSIPEGNTVPIGVPVMTILNTDPKFFWITNFLETLISCVLWPMCTSATIAKKYREIADHYADLTADESAYVNFQCHDFSMRGMFGVEAASMSGAAHLLFFKGTDTIPAIDFMERYYNRLDFIGGSVPATEHSVMCAGTKGSEFETFERLITEVYPAGIVSIVSDTYDFWNVIDNYLPQLKDKIMARDGKVVIRPDSGDPVKIICGDDDYITDKKTCEIKYIGSKGLIEKLWDIFGGTHNSKGYKVLDPHIGAIYGDSITLDRFEEILGRLKDKGFCASNIVVGIGSYSYQYVTRDTLGFAMKATWAQINGQGVPIFKDPITDNDSNKKSAKGLLYVGKNENGYYLEQDVTPEREAESLLLEVFNNGKLI